MAVRDRPVIPNQRDRVPSASRTADLPINTLRRAAETGELVTGA